MLVRSNCQQKQHLSPNICTKQIGYLILKKEKKKRETLIMVNVSEKKINGYVQKERIRFLMYTHFMMIGKTQNTDAWCFYFTSNWVEGLLQNSFPEQKKRNPDQQQQMILCPQFFLWIWHSLVIPIWLLKL